MPLLENVTMDEFAEGRKECRTVILPVGALEEHGSHLPLGTDAFHAEALARQVAECIPVWVAPPLFYGLCRSASEHPGTVGIRSQTLHSLIKDIVRGLYRQEMRNIVVLSGHAGGTHMAAMIDACEQLVPELTEIKIAVVSVLDIGSAAWNGILETQGDSHAGEAETSLMLHLRPGLVKGSAPEEYPVFPRYILVRNKRKFWNGGVWGNPGAASEEKGIMLMERSVRALVELIGRLEAWSEDDES